MNKLTNILFKPVSIAPLVTFRILFGAATFISTLRFLLLGWVDLHFVNTQVQFKYFGFYWVDVLPANAMYFIHGLMLLASVGIMFGAYYRLAATVFFICFTYCELIDITYYLNHYYFVSVVSFLMIWVPANSWFSVDANRNSSIKNNLVPAWCVYIFKAQLLLVYFFAGIAKINYDWLIDAMPLRLWLPANNNLPMVGWLFNYPATAYIFSWAGMLFDVFVGVFLLMPKTRVWAWLVVVFFHTITGAMFQIGVFPLVMILSTLIFLDESFHLKVQQILAKLFGSNKHFHNTETSVLKSSTVLKQNVVTALLVIWFSFHVLFPLRFVFYPGKLFWTEEGYRFGWRVMLMEKAGTAIFYLTDADNGKEGVVDNTQFLNPHQEKQMAMQPDLILQYAQFLKNHYETRGVKINKVRAEVYVTLNAKPSKLLFSDTLNLLQLSDSWAPKTWILPYE